MGKKEANFAYFMEHAILLTASTAGFPTMMTALMSFREETGA